MDTESSPIHVPLVPPEEVLSSENEKAAETVRQKILSELAAAVEELSKIDEGSQDAHAVNLARQVAQLTNKLTEFYGV